MFYMKSYQIFHLILQLCVSQAKGNMSPSNDQHRPCPIFSFVQPFFGISSQREKWSVGRGNYGYIKMMTVSKTISIIKLNNFVSLLQL